MKKPTVLVFLLELKQTILQSKYKIWFYKLENFYYHILRYGMRYSKQQNLFRLKKNIKANNMLRWKTLLYSFYLKQQAKVNRKKRTPRLKNMHWFVPSYIHFNFKTLQGVLCKSPSTKDIHFPFKGSLLKVYSFYRSTGL
jgi:hypothetical protein